MGILDLGLFLVILELIEFHWARSRSNEEVETVVDQTEGYNWTVASFDWFEQLFLFEIIDRHLAIFVAGYHDRRKVVWNDCVDWGTTFAQFDRCLNLAISEIPKCDVRRLVSNNEQVGVSRQPTAACCYLLWAFIAKMEWSERLVVFIDFVWIRVRGTDNILAVPNIYLVVGFDRQQLVQEWVVLQLPDWLLDVIFPDSYTVVVAAGLRILLFKFEIWDFPYPDNSFDATWKQQSLWTLALLGIRLQLRASDRQHWRWMSSQGKYGFQKAIFCFKLPLDISKVPELDLAVVGCGGQCLRVFDVVLATHLVEVTPYIELQLDFGHSFYRLFLLSWCSWLRSFGLSINNLLHIFIIFILLQNLIFQLLHIICLIIFQPFIFEVFFHFFLSFVVEGFDFVNLVDVENIIVADFSQEFEQKWSLSFCSSFCNFFVHGGIQICLLQHLPNDISAAHIKIIALRELGILDSLLSQWEF